MSKGTLTMGLLCTLGLGGVPLGCDAGDSSGDETQSGTSVGPGNDSGGTDGDGTADESEGDPSDGTETADSDSDGEIVIEPGDIIDDLEDGDPLIFAAGGRRGAWYTYNDASEGAEQLPPAPFVPTEGGPGTSLYMAQTSGSGFSEWGAGLGVDLNNEGDPDGGDGMRMTYDASAYQGIVFHARGTTPIRVKLLIDAIVPEAAGGSCVAEKCEDAHGKIITLTDEWVQYTVDFDEAFQEGWGEAADFDPGTLLSVQFQVDPNTDFDFALDQVGFY